MTMTPIPTPSFPMERMTHKFFAALYRGQAGMMLRCYYALVEKALGRDLTETDEKYLRQTQAAVKRLYLDPAADRDGDGLPAPLKDIYKKLQAFLLDRARQAEPWHLDYTAWKERIAPLEDWQETLLFQTAITFQLTSGCANFCRRCNEWALPRVRGHFSRDAAKTILGHLLALNNRDLALYGGSDPLDWEDGTATLIDLFDNLGHPVEFSLLTKIPRGKERRLRALADRGIDIAVSLTNRNRARVEALESLMGACLTKQHATSDLLIPAGLDEDFSTVKPSITDSYGAEISPDGACIIIPTFTSALYPFGHKKIPVTRATPWFPVKRIGRPALLQDYFKPLQVIGKDGTPFFLDHLLDVQVENILLDDGRDDLTPPGMRSVKEYFEVFDEKARLKRRAMTLSVMRRLKRETLRGASYRDLPLSGKTDYRNRLAAHLDFTRKEKVLEARRCAAAFFLSAAREYIRVNPIKTEIIAHLTRKEFQGIHAAAGNSAGFNTDNADPETFAWQRFRHQLLCLIHGKNTGEVSAVIAACRAVYDPARDLFVAEA